MTHPRTATLQALAEMVGGKVVGDPDTLITAAHPINDATPGSITLADNALRVRSLEASSAAAAVVGQDAKPEGIAGIQVDDVHDAFSRIVLFFRPPRATVSPGIHPTAIVAESARVDPTAVVHAGVVVGEDSTIGPQVVLSPGVVIGAGCRVDEQSALFANVTLYDNVSVGKRCRIHSGAVLGAYGFGYSQQEGRHVLSAQLGGVEIADDVDIGAAATIDRGVYGPTRVGEGTKIDNLVQIAHNCQVGKHNIICSQVGVAGSTTTGDYVVMGGQVGVRDHVEIGDGAVIGAKAGVSNSVPAGARMLGSPAYPERDQKLQFAAVAKLPAMRKDFKQLRKAVERLQQALFGEEKHRTNDRAA